MIVGDYVAKYIGANHIHGTWLGGIESSFDGVFQDEQVLIGSGLDYTPCIIGDISDIYVMFGKNVAERQPHTFEDYAICMMKTIQEYFGDYSNIDERMNNYPDTDYIEDGIPIGKVSNLKGMNAAMCVERAMVAQNLLRLLGIKSFYKCSGILKNDKSVKKVAKKGYKWAKMLIKLFTLVSTLYGIYTATTDVTFVSVLMAVFMTSFYLMKLFFSLMVEIISHKVKKVAGIFKNKNKDEVEVR
jgi:hypothetical protein